MFGGARTTPCLKTIEIDKISRDPRLISGDPEWTLVVPDGEMTPLVMIPGDETARV